MSHTLNTTGIYGYSVENFAEFFLLPHVICLCDLGAEKITLQLMRDIITTMPRDRERDGRGAFEEVFMAARKRAHEDCQKYMDALPNKERQALKQSPTYNEDLRQKVISHKNLQNIFDFFLDSMLNISWAKFDAAEKACLDFFDYLMSPFVLISLTKHSGALFENNDLMNIELDGRELTKHFPGELYADKLNALPWKDIKDYFDYHPYFIISEHSALIRDLGYVPGLSVLLPHIREWRTIFYKAAADKPQLYLGEYSLAGHEVIKKIRNDSMKKGQWLDDIPLTAKNIEDYQTYYAPWAGMARERLAKALGYYPDLLHSYPAEIDLRYRLANNELTEGSAFESSDYRAVESTNYRKIFIEQGEAAADASTPVKFERELKDFARQQQEKND